MSRNWILALVAAVIWGVSYAWYFIGLRRVRPTLLRWLRALWPRRPDAPK